MPAKIPATVVTGFLGAGKTTLIRHMLQNAEGKRIALIINEFGDLGVDGDILKGCGDEVCTEDDIVELSNGCICCTVADDFIPTMEQLLARDPKPDHIVIETSGLALPQPLVRAFNWPGISTKVTVDGVVTVVDGRAVHDGQFAHNIAAVDAQRAQDENLDHETPLSELFEDQIACADMIVINKTDLLDASEADDLQSRLKTESRDGVQVVKAAMGALPVDVLLGQGIGAESDLESRHEVHHHHHHDDDHDGDHHHDHAHEHGHDEFESFIVTRPLDRALTPTSINLSVTPPAKPSWSSSARPDSTSPQLPQPCNDQDHAHRSPRSASDSAFASKSRPDGKPFPARG